MNGVLGKLQALLLRLPGFSMVWVLVMAKVFSFSAFTFRQPQPNYKFFAHEQKACPAQFVCFAHIHKYIRSQQICLRISLKHSLLNFVLFFFA